MAKKLALEVGNFTCRFEEKELLDCFEERFWPLVSKKRTWPYGRNEDKNFVFYGFRIIKNNKDFYLVGRIIRNMKLTSVQKYNKTTELLTRRNQSMEDSPTVFFVLRLIDHKVILIKETARAPRISQVEDFFRTAMKIHRVELKERESTLYRSRLGRRRLTKEQKCDFDMYFINTFPFAQFRITPIGSYSRAAEAFADVEALEYFAVTLHQTNSQKNNFRNSLMKKLAEAKRSLGHGDTTSVKAILADKTVGLDKEVAVEIAQDVAMSEGNASLVAKGDNSEGIEVIIRDTELSIKDTVEIEDVHNENLKATAGIQKLIQHAGDVPDSEEVEINRAKVFGLVSRLGYVNEHS